MADPLDVTTLFVLRKTFVSIFFQFLRHTFREYPLHDAPLSFPTTATNLSDFIFAAPPSLWFPFGAGFKPFPMDVPFA